MDTVKEAMAALDFEVFEDILDKNMEQEFSRLRAGLAATMTIRSPAALVQITDFRSQCRLMQCVKVLLVFHEAVRHGNFGLPRDIIPMLPILFWSGR